MVPPCLNDLCRAGVRSRRGQQNQLDEAPIDLRGASDPVRERCEADGTKQNGGDVTTDVWKSTPKAV